MDRRPSNEDKPQSKTDTLEPSLNLISVFLLKRTTSMRCMGNLPFESTRGHLFSGTQLQWHLSREDCITLCSLHWGASVLATQTQHRRFQGNLFTSFPLCTPSWTPPSTWGKWVCITQHIRNAELTHRRKCVFGLPLLSQNSTFSIINFNHSIYKLVHFTFFLITVDCHIM